MKQIFVYWGILVGVSAILGVLATVIIFNVIDSPPWWSAVVAGLINACIAIWIAEIVTRRFEKRDELG